MGSNGQEWCWKRHGETLSNHVISKVVKHGRGSIMVRVAWVGRALGRWPKPRGKWIASIIRTPYKTTWACQLKSLEKYRRSGCSNMITTQNIPVSQHLWFNNHKVSTLPSCPQSYYLSVAMNLIEQLWNKVDWRLQNHKDLPTGKNDLRKKL